MIINYHAKASDILHVNNHYQVLTRDQSSKIQQEANYFIKNF